MRNPHSYLVAGLAFLLSGISAFGGNTPETVSYIKNRKKIPDLNYQKRLRSNESWQKFVNAHPHWMVIFNESTSKPHRAYGKEIPVSGSTPEQKAINFINQELASYLPVAMEFKSFGQLETQVSNDKFDQVNFDQYFHGIKVIDSRVTVKLIKNGGVIMYGLDVYDNINTPLSPALTKDQAATAAEDGLSGILSTKTESVLEILPVPVSGKIEYHLVYKVMVTTNNGGMPGKYHVLVDALSGEVLYRQNRVYTEHAPTKNSSNTSISAYGTVSYDNLKVPVKVKPLVNLAIDNNGTKVYTDANGDAELDLSGSSQIDIPLAGKWVTVVNADPDSPRMYPTYKLMAQPGSNQVNFDGEASLEELSAYYNTNIIHDHMNRVLPNFVGLDKSLTANVDIQPAICNAYYDGTAINFFKATPGCASLALVSDVIFHEYGHGINDFYYREAGAFFNNGAMHEGYADWWALSLNEDAILADGYNPDNLNESIRRYDKTPKVYPKDIASEPHNDGEIICGAWWDTYKNLGDDMNKALYLFSIAYDGLQATGPDGDEGKIFTDVLIDVLQADDDDADLSNGTPNGMAITTAFKRHGISLVSAAEIEPMTPLMVNAGLVNIDAKLIIDNDLRNFVGDVILNYKINQTNTWTTLIMTSSDKENFRGELQNVSKGSIIKYYFSSTDSYGGTGVIAPFGADKGALPNIAIVGFTELKRDDADGNYRKFGPWKFAVSGDDAVDGLWERCKPVGSFDPYTGATIAPDVQTSPNGSYCYTTGNQVSEFDYPYYHDVDAGKTTLESPVMDMSGYTNPTISYNRWFTNASYWEGMDDNDPWVVKISNDNGSTWKTIENTAYDAPSWRANAFRVRDLLTPTDKMKMRFIASDAYVTNGPYQGASLVEAAMDDMVLYESDTYNSVADMTAELGRFILFPNPSSGELNISLPQNISEQVSIRIMNLTGNQVHSQEMINASANVKLDLPVLADGMYLLELNSGGRKRVEKFNLIH